jgi:hypothetical protein
MQTAQTDGTAVADFLDHEQPLVDLAGFADLAHSRVVSRARGSRAQAARPLHVAAQFATEALAAGVSTFGLARVMGSSIQMVEMTYGHLAKDSEQQIRARLDARSRQMGVGWASGGDD